MKSNVFFRRLTALALCFLFLFSAAPLPRASATVGEDDTLSSQNDSDAAEGGDAKIESGTTAGGLADPLIDATAALLVNADTGMVLYEKNADERRYPASTTKVMTALLTLEHVEDLEEIVTAQESDFENVTADSSNADIKVGEQVRVIDLLYALMLPSANEAAYMLARHVGGSYEEFVNMMNARAQELGCTGTHFSNPCGLHADDHYSTARDLLLISQAAMQDETFVTIAETAQYRMPATNMHDSRIIFTTSSFSAAPIPGRTSTPKGLKPVTPRRLVTAWFPMRKRAGPSCIRSCSAARTRRTVRLSPRALPKPTVCSTGALRTLSPKRWPSRGRRSRTSTSACPQTRTRSC